VGLRADLCGRLGFDQPLHRVFENASEHVRVGALKLIEQRLVRHPVLGHRGSPGLGKSFQENSAVAFFVYLVGSTEVTPDLHHDKGHHWREIRFDLDLLSQSYLPYVRW
jgi:hypothetical protein